MTNASFHPNMAKLAVYYFLLVAVNTCVWRAELHMLAVHRQIAEQAMSLMGEDVSLRMTIPELARACSTSPTVLKQAFREVHGETIYQWLKRRRADMAADMLATSDLSIAQIAATVGYSNPSKFSHAFSACKGMTPRAWRSAHRAALR